MSDLYKKMEILNEKKKDNIIKDIMDIPIEVINNKLAVSSTQAQNLREYATRTDSIEEILLYIKYQCVREGKMKNAGNKLEDLIDKKYRNDGIEAIRFMLGVFARHVKIKESGIKKPDNEPKGDSK